MDCRYNKYFEDLLYGNLKEEKKLELIRHAEGCSECSDKLREIEEIDGAIRDVMEYSTYKDFRLSTLKAAEEIKGSTCIRRIIYKSYKYVCAAAVVFIIIILAYSSGLLANMNKSTGNSDSVLGNNSGLMYDKVYEFDPPLTKAYDGVTVKVKKLEVLPHQVIATFTGGNNIMIMGFEAYDDQGNYASSRSSSSHLSSEDSYSLIFEMFTLKSKYITIRPYSGYVPAIMNFPEKLPATLTSGAGLIWLNGKETNENRETLTLTGVDYLSDKTVLHFEHEGVGLAQCFGILDGEGKSYSALNNESIISSKLGNGAYIQEFPPLPKDSIKKISINRSFCVPELAEQLEIKIPIGDDK